MALTWREVSAPDLSTSLRGYEMFGRGIENALGGLRETLNNIDQQKTQEASQGLMLQALQAQDPDAVRAIVAGVNPAQVNSAAIAMLSQRPGQILQEQNLELALKGARRTDAQTEAFDALVSDQARAEEARAQGRPDAALEASIMGRLSSIGGRNAMAVTDSLRDAEIWGIDRTGKLQNQSIKRDENIRAWNQDKRDQARFNMDQTEFDWRAQDRRLGEIADRAIFDVLDKGYDRAGVLDMIRNAPAELRPALLQRANAQGFGGLFTPDEVGISIGGAYAGNGSGGGIGADFSFGAPQQAVAGELKKSGLSDNVIAGFLGNFHVEGGYGGAKGDGGTAAGIAQWRGERQANFRKVIGKEPTAASPAEQARFVKWELDNPERAGMTKAEAAAIKAARSPAEAAALIDRHFERSDQRSTGARSRAAQQAFESFQRASGETTRAAVRGSQIRNVQDKNDPVFQIYNNGIGKADVPAVQVANDLANGALKGKMSAEDIERAIIKGIDESGQRLNATQVGGLIARNNRPNDSFWSGIFGPARVVNEKGLSSDIAKILQGGGTRAAETAANRDDLAAQAAAAQQRADAANAALARVQAQASAGRNVDPNVLRRYQVNAATANAAAIAASNRIINADDQPDKLRKDQPLPPSAAANPVRRFGNPLTGQKRGDPVRQGSLISQLYEDWFGS